MSYGPNQQSYNNYADLNISNNIEINKNRLIHNFEKYPFLLLHKHPNNDYFNQMANNMPADILEIKLYSKENMEYLQKSIKKGVYIHSNKKFILNDQNEKHIKDIMCIIFYQRSEFLPDNLEKQLKLLNRMVVKECIKKIMINLKQHHVYLQDKFGTINLQSLPKNSSIKGI